MAMHSCGETEENHDTPVRKTRFRTQTGDRNSPITTQSPNCWQFASHLTSLPLNCEGSKSGRQLQVKVAGSRDCATNVRSTADFINRERHLAGAGSRTSAISMQMACVFVVLAALSGGVRSYDDLPQVTVMQGALRGLYLTSRKGRQFVGFQGVPYAKPPLGEMRFKVSRIQII